MTAPTATPGAFADFVDPASANKPRPRDLVGRTLAISPTRIEYGVAGTKPGETYTRITADVLVCDGDVITFGGNLARSQPNTMQVAAPVEIRNMQISSGPMVEALTPYVGKSVVLGKIRVGQSSNPAFTPPFLLDAIDAGTPERARAMQVWQAKNTAGWVNPEPQPIGGVAPAATAVQSAPNPAAMAAHVAGQTGNPQVAAAAPMTPEQFMAAMQAAQAPAAPAPPAIPAGWSEEMWRGLSDEQRGQVLGTGSPTPF